MHLFRKVSGKLLLLSVLAGFTIGSCFLVVKEMETSDLQAKYFYDVASTLRFHIETGQTDARRYPASGPYDQRLGYTLIERFRNQLEKRGFVVSAQARFSPKLLHVVDQGFFPAYVEKNQAGLLVSDRYGTVLFSALFPERLYPDFDSIQPLVLSTLLFIENRELLDSQYPHRNPAVEWDRLARASVDLIAQKLGAPIHVPGGSTLATQIEKYRHSPEGRTDSAKEKLRQMGSAALRAYLSGADTTKARRDIALTYLNSMPLAALPGYGEVNGLGDGLWAWFGADFETVNSLLASASNSTGENITANQAEAYRQVLSLLLSQRRPAYYLIPGHDDLERLTDQHLRLLANEKIISPAMRDAALLVHSIPLSEPKSLPTSPFANRKIELLLRTRLADNLGIHRLYDLERIDADARSTVDYKTQVAVSAALHQLSTTDAARSAGVVGYHLLNADNDLSNIIYSLILFEHRPEGNLLRIQADNNDQPLDISEGIKLDLGSTAKMRTMVHYLELIADLHGIYASRPIKALRETQVHPRDHLSRWVIDLLIAAPNTSLSATLDAALERQYSASPGEAFMTGGGLHTFENFNKEDNGKVMTVQRALEQSVNLVFIRLMRDIAYHHLYKSDGVGRWLDEDDSPKRDEYLRRFADVEGKTYLRRFYRKYHDKTPQEVLTTLTKSTQPVAKRLATAFRSIYPDKPLSEFTTYLKTNLPGHDITDKEALELYAKYSRDSFDLQDRGYIVRIHPLELWLAGYLINHPSASIKEVVTASQFERQQVYRWLFKSARQYAQNRRIQTLVEQEAFEKIHQAWQQLGYPFNTFTPSYASSIGASGDRPAALAELMGILLNEGIRYPTHRFDSVNFAVNTPYELRMALPEALGRRVLAPEVAAAARKALIGVVENGTAKRIDCAYKLLYGTKLIIAGKTGTGDHRRHINGAK